MEEFADTYAKTLRRLLREFGWVASSQQGRATVDSVFSRLFEFESPRHYNDQVDAEWEKMLSALGPLAAKGAFIRVSPQIYRSPATPHWMSQSSWIRHGLWQTFEFNEGPSTDNAEAMLEDRQGNMWFSIDGGVIRYDRREFAWFAVHGLGTDSVSGSLEDSEGNLWFGSEIAGVLTRYDGRVFETFTSADGLPDNPLVPMTEDSDNNVWFGARSGGGVCRYDGDGFTHFTLDDGPSGDTVLTIVADSEDNLWVGTDARVSKYDGDGFDVFTCRNELPLDGARDILEDQLGNLWFVSNKSLIQYDGRECRSFANARGLVGTSISLALATADGMLWFGTDQGVSRYDGAEFISFTTADGYRRDLPHRPSRITRAISGSRTMGRELSSTTAEGLRNSLTNCPAAWSNHSQLTTSETSGWVRLAPK